MNEYKGIDNLVINHKHNYTRYFMQLTKAIMLECEKISN